MKKILFILVALFCFNFIYAESPIGIGLFNPIQYPQSSESIKGLRVNLLYAENQDLTGIDLGLFLPFNFVNGNLKGIQLGIYNKVKANATGLQWGFVNSVDKDMLGAQLGLVNFSNSTMTGLQWGFVNIASKFKGLQFGAVNWAKNLNGLQVGFLNFKQSGGIFPQEIPFPFFPIVNWAF